MKNKLFTCLFYFATTVYASNTDFSIQAGSTITQILATLSRPIFIGGPKQVIVWKTLIQDLLPGIERFLNFQDDAKKPSIRLLISIIHTGFEPHKYAISEQALVAVLFFIRSINPHQKTIQPFITNKSYCIGNFECWKAINAHLFFARLIKDGKISCLKQNETAVYHPTNFDNNGTPIVIKAIAQAYGPFFQDITLNKELQIQSKAESPISLMDFANFQRDPRAYDGVNRIVFFKFPDNRLNLDLR
jgi:hypothetical protein